MVRSKKALINIMSTLILQVITVICGFIVPKMIIQSYGSNVNGLITSIGQFLAYITLLESGFGPVVKSLLYKPIANKNKQEIEGILYAAEKFFRNIAKIFIAYIAGLCVLYPLIINTEFNSIYTISLIIILAIGTFAEYFFGITYTLYLQAEQHTYIISYIQIISTILNTIIVASLIYFNFSIQIVKLVSILFLTIRPIILNIYVKKKYKINLKNVNTDHKIKQKWEGLAQHIAFVIHSNTDVVVLSLFTNTAEVSVYSIYMLVLNGLKNVVFSIRNGTEASFGDMIARDESENLREKFKVYELFYCTIVSILYICTLVLIIPFVQVYIGNNADVNYIRPVFAIIIVLAEFVWAIRLPYASITQSAGHFKQTQKGSWIETIINIVISLCLVFRFGMIGVAIGTLIAMIYRTIDYMIYSSKYILKRNILTPFYRIIVVVIETILIAIICPKLDVNSYVEWIKYAIIVFIISLCIIIPTNLLIYRKDTKVLKDMIKNIIKRKK